MLRIICLKAGPLYSAEYVNILHDMVMRNLPEGMEGSFECFTDDKSGLNSQIIARALPEKSIKGWWGKLSLFKDRLFNEGDRIVYFDLDTVITGPLDGIVAYDGHFAILRDFYRPSGLQSSVMAWEANKQSHIWNHFQAHGFPEITGGDQAWIEKCLEVKPDLWQDLFPGSFCSYKEHARLGVPRGTKVCVFHGEPRPHEVLTDWVPMVWKTGGGTSAELMVTANMPIEEISGNIKDALERGGNWLHMQEPHEGIAAICAGGPSLVDDLPMLRAKNIDIFAINGAYKFLETRGIKAQSHVILDGRYENIQFVPVESGPKQFYSSQCHPAVLDTASDLTLWHPYFDGIVDIVGEDDDSAFIGGGTTAGLKSTVIAYTLGYRKIHMFGFDSCYRNGENHAYKQSLNENERVLDVSYDGKDYKCAPWMVTQAEDFGTLIPELVSIGAEIVVHGEGLIPAMAAVMGRGDNIPASDLRARAILSRLHGIPYPKVAEIGVFAGDLSKRLLGQRSDLHLVMIDSWSSDHPEEFKDTADFHSNLSAKDQEGYYKLAQAVTSFAKDRATIIRKPSSEAAKEIEDNFLDLVFIDADHSYEGCKRDIEAYYGKVKPGGIIAGHDYANNEWKFGPMVKRAVDEFIASKSLALDLGENYTWFAVKPGENA